MKQRQRKKRKKRRNENLWIAGKNKQFWHVNRTRNIESDKKTTDGGWWTRKWKRRRRQTRRGRKRKRKEMTTKMNGRESEWGMGTEGGGKGRGREGRERERGEGRENWKKNAGIYFRLFATACIHFYSFYLLLVPPSNIPPDGVFSWPSERLI